MPKVSLTVPHELGEDEARKRIQQLLVDVREKYGRQVSDIREEWNGNSCDLGWKSMGMGMTATIQVHPSDVTVDGNMPMAFMAFKGKMEQLVRERVTQALAPTPA